MKLPEWLRGKSDEPKPPELPLPPVDEKALAAEKKAAEKKAAEDKAERARVAQERQEKPGPAAQLLHGQYPAEPLKTEGPKPGAQPPDRPERVPSQLRNEPTPQPAPDVQTPGQNVTWVNTPMGRMAVPALSAKQAEFRAMRDAAEKAQAKDHDKGDR